MGLRLAAGIMTTAAKEYKIKPPQQVRRMKFRFTQHRSDLRPRVWLPGLAGLLLLCAPASWGWARYRMPRVHWRAQWIWAATPATSRWLGPQTAAGPGVRMIPPHRNQFLRFRKSFHLTRVPRFARLAIFAVSRYELWINGHRIGQGPAKAPEYWGYYDVFSAARWLRPGRNVIAVEVHWFQRPTAGFPVTPGSWGHGALLCQLALGHGSGRRYILSDGSWRVAPNLAWKWHTPRMDANLPDIEDYRARPAQARWRNTEFNDHSWSRTVVLRNYWGVSRPPVDPYIHLTPRPLAYPLEREIHPARLVSAGWTAAGAGSVSLLRLARHFRHETLRPDAAIVTQAQALLHPCPRFGPGCAQTIVHPLASGATPYLILDMGKEVDGYPRLAIRTSRPVVVNIGWGERLAGGNVTANQPGGRFVARYHARAGAQSWTMFSWHGLRFVELEFPHLQAPLRVAFGLRFSTARLRHAGHFLSSDAELNQLWRMGAYTWQLCTYDGTMDCPTREQDEWVGDGQVELQVNGVADGNQDIARKFLLDAAREQRRDGATLMASDNGEESTGIIVDYVFSFVNAVHDFYLQTGNRRFLRRMLPHVNRAMHWFHGLRRRDGLLGRMPYWVFLDWSMPDKHGESEILNALYYHTLQNAAAMAQTCGESRRAARYRRDAREIRAHFARFWNPGRKLYMDSWDHGRLSPLTGQLGNADAVLFGLAPRRRIAGILNQISDPRQVKMRVISPGVGQNQSRPGFQPARDIVQAQTYGMFFVLRALTHFGRDRAALAYIRQLWGPMIRAGNGTFWENFKQATGTSCHAWSAAPTYFLTHSILGIQARQPGYRAYRVAPHPSGLQWARGDVPTVAGPIAVRWQWRKSAGGEEFVLRLQNPAGPRARIVLPRWRGQPPLRARLNGRPAAIKAIVVSQPGRFVVRASYPSRGSGS